MMIFLNLPELYYGFTDILVKFIPHGEDFLIHYHDSIETLSFSAVILSAIFVYWQIKLFIQDYQKKNERSEYDKSYAMAKFYGEKLLGRMLPVEQLLQSINKRMIVDYNEIYPEAVKNMHLFTYEEADKLFEKTNIDAFQNVFTAITSPKAMIHFFSLVEGKTSLEIQTEWNNIIYGHSPAEINSFYRDKRRLVKHHIANVFNDLEYFSMVFCSGLAVPDNVYASLHQTYIHFVEDGYLYIARHNNKKGHEFYTHITELYRSWSIKSKATDAKNFAKQIYNALGKKTILKIVLRIFTLILIPSSIRSFFRKLFIKK